MATTEAGERYELRDILQSPCLPYQPSTLPMLISYLDEHASKNSVKPELCTAILKLYILYPQCTEPLVLRKIIIQGLVNIAENDPVIYLSMIPNGSRSNKKVSEVLQLTEYVQTCKFKHVWELLKESSMQDVVQTPGLIDSLRQFVCHIISLTFQSISLSDFIQFVNLGPQNAPGFDDRLEKLVKSHGWQLEDISGQKCIVLPAISKEGENTRAANAVSSATHRAVEKFLGQDGLKVCLSTLLKCSTSS